MKHRFRVVDWEVVRSFADFDRTNFSNDRRRGKLVRTTRLICPNPCVNQD
ncbi:hypothetical protein ACQCU1_15575 [Sutcliffiella horikoshii]